MLEACLVIPTETIRLEIIAPIVCFLKKGWDRGITKQFTTGRKPSLRLLTAILYDATPIAVTTAAHATASRVPAKDSCAWNLLQKGSFRSDDLTNPVENTQQTKMKKLAFVFTVIDPLKSKHFIYHIEI